MMNGRDRTRQPPPSDPRRGAEARNGAGDGSMSRAEKFEDEKKRIIQSCYSKKEADGTLVESYITHVRITEDSAHPSAPAPPDSAPGNKKPRVIIVSVRRSGRVRMHKARENNDGTFSIGKTWMLDDLSSIQSYSAFVPRTPVEQQQKDWASNVGFTVTVGKPYYWHARSAKEKEFFIGSLVKIYKKYTGGKVPSLNGFDERERQSLIGGGPSAPSPAPPAHPAAPTRPSAPPSALPAPQTVPTRPPAHTTAPTRPSAPLAHPPPEIAAPVQSSSAYGSREPSRDGPREMWRKPFEEPELRPKKSREQMSRPSTASKPAPSPFGTSPNAPSPIPAPRAETKPKETPTTFLADESTLLGSQEEVRSTPPRVEEGGLQSQPPPLAPQPLEPSAPIPKRSTDGLRPTTPAGPFNSEARGGASSPASSAGQRSPYRDANENVPVVEKHPRLSQDKVAQETPSPEAPAIEPRQVVSDRDRSSSPIAVEPEVAAAVVAVDEPPKSAPEASPEQPPDVPPEPTEEEEEEVDGHRPGLGPMVKKKSTREIAGAFRKAANAYGAFKPRPGGAGERLMAAAKKQKAEGVEPDGITGVVPAPSLNREPPKSPVEEPADKEVSAPAVVSPPTFEITQPAVEEAPMTPVVPVASTPDTEKILPLPEQSQESLPEVAIVNERSRTPSPGAQGRRRRREDHTIKYCQALGIEPSALDGRGIEFDEILTDLGWNGRLGDEQKIEDLEADIRREIGRVEATSWLGNLEQQEGKVEQLAVLIDKTIEECEELDGLLTLYSHELNTLHDDVSYIEAQSQGLQVQTANQKLLQNELQNLLKTLSISTSDIYPLKHADMNDDRGLQDTEHAVAILYKAMLMIDADIGQNKKRLVDASVGVYANTEIGQMRAIKQKKEEYHSAAVIFLERLKKFMGLVFQNAKRQIEGRDQDRQSKKDPLKLDLSARQNFRSAVWRFNPMMLFAREVSMSEWHGLVQLYEQSSKSFFQNEFRDNGMAWKHTARKPTGEEQELLFTHQEKEKEAEGITLAARKLTVRRGKTVRAAAGLRLPTGEKKQGKVEPCEAFAGTLREMVNLISEEQNFVVRFFHLNSLANADYADLVASAPPESRQCPEFSVKQSHDPDRGMAKRVEQIMDEVYSFWPNEMQGFVDWAVQADPLQGIGILFALESTMTDLDDTNQEFIIHSLQKVHSRLMGLFNRFVDEQIRGIEDTKVKVNKRKGVISFMRIFPNFSTAVENMLAQRSGEFCDIRVGVNDAYDRINRAMWESLKFIAKEAPGQPPGVAASAGDPEDKEALNYHILLIENMNHYVEEVDVHNLPVLERWVGRARQDFEEHMKLYLDAVIHRPLGKLLDFIQSIETLQANGNSADVATRASHSRMVAKKVLSSHDAKEVRRGVEMLKKRVEKHFGDADDPGLSRSLVLKVLRECEIRYEDAHDRMRRIIDTVYEGQLELEWRKEDIVPIFRK